MDDEYELDESDVHKHDVRGIITFLRDCWLVMPHLSLGEMIEEIFGGDIKDLEDSEMVDILKEFLIQNE